MEFVNGVRVTPHYHELSPLEAAIVNFERHAKSYHRNKRKVNKGTETPEQRAQREAELATALKHLQQERRLAMVTIEVQAQLEAYRDQLRSKTGGRADRKANRDSMRNEKHHPTYVLAKYMRADGRPQPSPNHTAHHIIPGRGKTAFAAQARVNLHMCDIRINDPVNGAWMVRRRRDKGHWSMPAAKSHSEVHTHNYEKWVFNNTQMAMDEMTMRASLRRLRLLLETGKQPEKVTMPPDEGWNGNV